MFELHPSYLDKDGKTEFVTLSIEEFQSLKEHLEDMEDLLDLRSAKREEGELPTLSLRAVKKELGI